MKEAPPDSGRLHPIASSMLMRILYAGRMARFDLLRAVNSLACVVAYWDDDADRRLHQLVSYINCTLKYRQTGWIGDDRSLLAPHDYCDANFAGCPRTLRSTSGIQQQLEGPNSCFPLSAMSKRQAHANDSTPAAELSALHKCIKEFTIPAIDMWQRLLPGTLGIVHEDNTTCIATVQSGRNQTMRFLLRSGGVSVQFLHENLNKINPLLPYQLAYTDSKLMVADIHTKGFPDAPSWYHAHTLAGIIRPGDLVWRATEHAKYFGLTTKIPKTPKEDEE